MYRKPRSRKQYKPVGFGDAQIRGSVEDHRRVMCEAALNRYVDRERWMARKKAKDGRTPWLQRLLSILARLVRKKWSTFIPR